MYLIGSRAAKHWDHNFRSPKDWDFIVTFKESNEIIKNLGKRIENLHISQNGDKIKIKLIDKTCIELEILNFIESDKILLNEQFAHISTLLGGASVLTPEYLFVLKKSHIYWNVNWNKNIEDYLFMKNNWKMFFEEKHHEFYKRRFYEHKIKFGNSKIDLNMSNDNFFDKSEKQVKRDYPHDHLHELVKYYDEPLYKKIKQDQNKALVSKKMWNELNDEQKVQLAKEEAMVIAIERYLLKGEKDEQKAYEQAIARLATSMTKGWFQDFIIDNYLEIKLLDQPILKITKALKKKK